MKPDDPVDDYVGKLLLTAPPLTPEQRERLRPLLKRRLPGEPTSHRAAA